MSSRAATVALSISLCAILGISFFSWGRAMPESSQLELLPGEGSAPLVVVKPLDPEVEDSAPRADQESAPRGRHERVKPRDRDSAPHNREKPKPRNGNAAPLMESGVTYWKGLDIPIEIRCEDRSVEGAWVSAKRTFDDTPITSVKFRERQGSSAANGRMVFQLGYPDTIQDDDRYCVMAHHPHLGFGVEELTFGELRRFSAENEAVEIHLERGKSVEGCIVDENGIPIPGVRVTAFGRSDSLLNQSGIHTYSDEIGNFVLRGIVLKNRPYQIIASVEDTSQTLGRHRRFRPRRTVVAGLGKVSFDEQIGGWNAGVIALPSTASGGRIPAPEEELADDEDEEFR